MRYTLQKQPDGTYLKYRHGELSQSYGGRPTNAELEFWKEIESHSITVAQKFVRTRIANLETKVASLQESLAKMSHRRCHPCGHEGYYLLNILPYCKCEKCGSADTRQVKQ